MNESSEIARLAVLRQLNLLDTPASASFDRITRMACRLFDLPIAAVSLTDKDRQWFKSRVGVEHCEIPREGACCGAVTDSAQVLVVNDLLESEQYRDTPLAHSGVRFYAGAPLITRDGFVLGAMCVLGHNPREISSSEINTLKDLAAMAMAQVELQHAVGRVDPITGLPNYNQFVDDLADLAMDHPGVDIHALSTELVDLNRASNLQRVMGPAYLDDLARSAARKLSETLGVDTRLYYLGGCQFAHLDHSDAESVMTNAKALLQPLITLQIDSTAPFMLRPVVGVAEFTVGQTSPANALRLAHSASRDARLAECSVGTYSSDSDARYQRHFGLLKDFRKALDAIDQLQLVFQPRIAMSDGRCVGCEALIRWHHPTLGPISPAEFIPLVENTSLARPLTDWVIRNAVRQAASWYRSGLDLRVSINIAASNLDETDFCQRLLEHMARHQLPMQCIELELTESGLIDNGKAARSQLDALKRAGFSIAIDDFGTGYSSLAYLQSIPANIVKIDRSFIDGLENNRRGQKLVRAMIGMAHDLGYQVVAEGIETAVCYRLLDALGCDEAQGYLLAKPLEAAALEQWLPGSAATRRSARA